MAEIPCALLKDLRSTGYFFNELKNYSDSPEMDISRYCRDFATPYLVRTSDSYDRSGKSDKSKILRLAILNLSKIDDSELRDSIFALKKVAVSEIDKAAKVNLQEQLDKPGSMVNRHKQESAEFLAKLLVNIIKMFKLTEPNARQKKTDELPDPVGEAVIKSWETLEPTAV